MAKSKRPTAQTPPPDVGAATMCADAFYRSSLGFIRAVPADISLSGRYAGSNLGEMVVSATNLAFAIELYLKALILQSGNAFPHIHLLSDLYRLLPLGLQDEIGSAFQARMDQADKVATAGVVVQIRLSSAGEPPFNNRGPLPRGCVALLQRSAHMFVTWRYLFAHGETEPGKPIRFEYVSLCVLAEELRARLPVTQGAVAGLGRLPLLSS